MRFERSIRAFNFRGGCKEAYLRAAGGSGRPWEAVGGELYLYLYLFLFLYVYLYLYLYLYLLDVVEVSGGGRGGVWEGLGYRHRGIQT